MGKGEGGGRRWKEGEIDVILGGKVLGKFSTNQ